MKKYLLIAVFLTVAASAFAYTFTGLSWEASQNYDEFSVRNYLPWNASELEHKYGVNVHIFKFNAVTKIDPERMAAAYYGTITKTPEDKILLIWLSNKPDDGVIMASDALEKTVPEEELQILQDDVLRTLSNRWYISEQMVLGKILGTILYRYEKPVLDNAALDAMQDRYIRIDDPLYRTSMHQPFFDLIRLFEFEPISFCLYFPFIMYAFLVRLIGANLGRGHFIFFNVLWAAATGFIFILILNRVNIIFPEYVRILAVIIGLNLPFYIILFRVYWNDVEAAAYKYLYNITGGFSSGGNFGAAK